MIEKRLLNELRQIFLRYKKVEKVVLFGSRARGDNSERSDIDLCLFGDISHGEYAEIYMDIEEINTYLSFDILNFNELKKEELIKNILREGIEIYNG